ncbi:MAG: four helix bundle protein [Planctomycetota bacterium]
MFDHEKLKVYQEAIRFATWADGLLQPLPKGSAVRDQLDRASTSIALNIAEGNGKFTGPDRCRFLDIARGSAFECAACLDLLIAKGMVEAHTADEGKGILRQIVSMLVGLIKAISADRVFEDTAEYGRENSGTE